MLEAIEILLESIGKFFILIFQSLENSLSFIIGIFSTLPELIYNIFSNLPKVYQYGISSLIGCIVLIIILKIVSLIKGAK